MRTSSRSNWFSFLRRIFPRKYLFTVPFALILATPFVCAQDNVIELTNADVLAMVRDKLPADAIIKKIQTSLCHFDTFPPVISELRYKGVPEEVLVAMVGAPVGRPAKPVGQTVSDNRDGESSPTTSEMPPAKSPPIASPSQKTIAGPAKEALSTRGPSGTQREKAAIDKGSISGKGEPLKRSGSSSSVKVPVESSVEPTSIANGETKSAKLPLPTPVKVQREGLANVCNEASSVPIVDSGPGDKRVAEPEPVEQPKAGAAAPRALTNSDIVNLLRDGSSMTGIVDIIKSSSGNYDLSAKALLDLRAAGADASVFLAMMEINQKTIEKKTAASSAGAVTPPGKPDDKK